jgi:hypothetical protein
LANVPFDHINAIHYPIALGNARATPHGTNFRRDQYARRISLPSRRSGQSGRIAIHLAVVRNIAGSGGGSAHPQSRFDYCIDDSRVASHPEIVV